MFAQSNFDEAKYLTLGVGAVNVAFTIVAVSIPYMMFVISVLYDFICSGLFFIFFSTGLHSHLLYMRVK